MSLWYFLGKWSTSRFCTYLLLSATYMSFADAQERNLQFASSEQPSSLVELYTSQGCSSCLPAERWISNFKHDQRLWTSVFPLAFHVDYWDYIGWKDEFAKPKYGTRQRQYQRLGLTHQVATPGFVVSGKGWNGWFRGQRLPKEQTVPALGKIELEIEARDLTVRYLSGKAKPDDDSFKINIALLAFDMNSNIDSGENRGRELKQDFVVLSLHHEFLLNKQLLLSQQELWSSRVSLPDIVDELGVTMALLAWISKGSDPRPIQVAGGWL